MMLTEPGASSTDSAVREAAETSSTAVICNSSGGCSPCITSTVRPQVSNPGLEMRNWPGPTGMSSTAGVNPASLPSTCTAAPRSSVLTISLPVCCCSSNSTGSAPDSETKTSCLALPKPALTAASTTLPTGSCSSQGRAQV